MVTTTKAVIPTIAFIQLVFGTWAAFHVTRQSFLGELSVDALRLGAVYLFLAISIAAGILLWARTKAGIWLSIGIQGLQMYVFSVWRISWGVVLGPHFLVRLWPPVAFKGGFRFDFYPVVVPEAVPFAFTINLIPIGAFIALLAVARGEDIESTIDTTV